MVRINSKCGLWLGVLFLLAKSNFVWASLNIFACEPEYDSLAQELAPNAEIYSATTAMQDPHLVQARPSLIAKMRKADLVVCAGADLEVGWLPMLQMKAANPDVRSTDKGLFFATDQVETLDKHATIDRSMGDVHAKGNPHVHFSPGNIIKVATALTAKLAQLDPQNKAEYQENLKGFLKRWQDKMPKWQAKAEPLNGMKVIGYHSNFRYLFDWLGVEQVADLEPKPGLPPSSSHLTQLLNRAKQGDVKAIVIASYQDPRGANWLKERTNLPVINLPLSVGGNEQSQDLFTLYDNVIDQLLGVAQ